MVPRNKPKQAPGTSRNSFAQSGNDCVVVEGGSTECNIYLPPETDQQQEQQQDQPEDQQPYGCACSSSGSNAVGWLPLALLILLGRRRR